MAIYILRDTPNILLLVSPQNFGPPRQAPVLALVPREPERVNLLDFRQRLPRDKTIS